MYPFCSEPPGPGFPPPSPRLRRPAARVLRALGGARRGDLAPGAASTDEEPPGAAALRGSRGFDRSFF